MTAYDNACGDRYLELLKNTLTGLVYDDDQVRGSGFFQRIVPGNRDERREGKDWPLLAHTMVGRLRLDNVQHCVERVLDDGIPGDLMETGVWRGGVTIFMRALLAARGVADRLVWVADSFAGLPPPRPDRYPADRGLDLSGVGYLSVSRAQVEANFERYGLLDGQVRFLEGWFRDTLPAAPIERLAVLRLDGDLYESTHDALVALYPKLSPGGFLIVDDYGHLEPCRAAVTDYRARHGIDEAIVPIDHSGVFWRRSASSAAR